MNAERLLSVLEALRRDIKRTDLVARMHELDEAVTRLAQQHQHPQIQTQVSEARSALVKAIETSNLSTFSPGWMSVIEELGLDDYFGNAFLNDIDLIFERNAVTPAAIASEINDRYADLKRVQDAINKTVDGLNALGFSAEDLKPGECEIGFIIPRPAVDNELSHLGTEFVELNRILGPFSELATGSRAPLEVRSIGASSFQVFVLTTLGFTVLFAKAAQEIIKVIKGVLDIKQQYRALKQQGVPAEALAGISGYADGVMATRINELAGELIEQFGNDGDTGRNNELHVELKVSLTAIARRIDEGYNVEIRAEPSDEQDAESDSVSDAEAYAAISAAQKDLKFINDSGQPILRLPVSLEDASPDASTAHSAPEPDQPSSTEENAPPKKKVSKAARKAAHKKSKKK